MGYSVWDMECDMLRIALKVKFNVTLKGGISIDLAAGVHHGPNTQRTEDAKNKRPKEVGAIPRACPRLLRLITTIRLIRYFG